MKTQLIKYAVISVLLNTILLSVIRLTLTMNYSSIIAFILYFIFTNILFGRLPDLSWYKKLLVILLGTVIVHVPQRLIDFQSQLVSLPEFACELAGVIFGGLYFVSVKWLKILTVLASMIFCTLIYKNYEVISNAVFDSDFNYDRSVSDTRIDAVPYLDSTHHVVNKKLFGTDKYLLINLWSTSCGSCMAEFPVLDSLYLIAASGSTIAVYSASILIHDDDKLSRSIVQRKGFHFPVLTIESWDKVKQHYGMNGVPLTYVVKNSRVLFRGSLSDAWGYIEEHENK